MLKLSFSVKGWDNYSWQDMIDLAEECGIAVLATPITMYEACGILYSNGLRGNSNG